ncbi:N-acetylmuramic acid 6-phosphate etherase [Fictibacillus macauensis ZFHKF-1]|uniref:N-acetylmuramic acid 6-phosphate etherase n=1 Tax=Fictibacillus macauensis ZFHKF-1 TaxID=1196324 RepID=I8AIK8_9BACL|nr:N-acetylmuramic acid 6-phosphate etherase [Fictibacillus macauensis]EIT85557.1 N-acetylmuramic acid 6-phosphate etherase [Fictibacillus macauensis ZFHKF-1]
MNIQHLNTEQRNPNTLEIDECSTIECLEKIANEDAVVAGIVRQTLPSIATVVDHVVAAFQKGGRLIYVGAGTSGRLGVLDASECPPTYGTPATMVVGIIAGGERALTSAEEGIEDDEQAGADDVARLAVGRNDVIVAIAASGRTPYALGALRSGNIAGAVTVALVCTEKSPMSKMAMHTIEAVTGPEVITGSTRMKAGTAQKLILNMISTTSMIGIGKVYSNLMVDVQPSNEKLVKRSQQIVMEATGCTAAEAQAVLRDQSGHAKTAIFQYLSGLSPEEARLQLQQHDGKLKQALQHTAR